MNTHFTSLLNLAAEDAPPARGVPMRAPWVAESGRGQVSIRPVSADIVNQRITDPIHLSGKVGQASFSLKISGEALRLAVRECEPMLDWDGLPPEGRILVLEHLFAPLLGVIEKNTCAPVELKSLDTSRPFGFVPTIGFDVVWRDLNLDVCGSFSHAHAEGLFTWVSRLPKRESSSITATVAVRRGYAFLTWASLKALEPGDGIVIETGTVEPGYWAVTSERYVSSLRKDETGVRLAETLLKKPNGVMRHFMDNDMTDNEPAMSEGVVGDIPVKLLFDAGRLEVPFRELEEIGEGHLFPLERHPADAVDIVANGRVIGRGELVVVDGLTAVRVTAINL